jgi:cytoskeletal protein RodZ
MKTAGDIIKEARLNKGYTRGKLGEITHIRASFIASIEKADWENLPDFNITLGFVKSIAHFLDIPENLATSVFKRDYPPKLKGSFDYAQKDNRNGPRTKEIGKKFRWGPRLTFLALVLIIIFVVLGYLGFQYRKFNLPPELVVDSPVENQVITAFSLSVSGKTDPDATISINDQPVIVDTKGRFTAQIDVAKTTMRVTVIAESRSGKATTISRTIKVQ